MGDNATTLSEAALALGVALVSTHAGAAAAKLLVFLHVAAKQRALQSDLQAALPSVSVTAVGRIADFERALQAGQDAVLTVPLVLHAYGLVPELRGRRQGASEETYCLVGVDAAPDPARVSAVGALDILGREGTMGFVHALLESKPRVERVTKVEDLLPLLQMRRVDAILLPLRLFAELRAASRLALAQRELVTKVGLPAAAKKGPLGAQVLTAIGRLPQGLSRALGVDEWR